VSAVYTGPASTTRTDRLARSDNRPASTDPAEPAPTITTSAPMIGRRYRPEA
jgi:hypothetical protein